jgi:hypothetical protein
MKWNVYTIRIILAILLAASVSMRTMHHARFG